MIVEKPVKKKTANLIIVLQGLFCIVLFWLVVYFGKNEYDQHHQIKDDVISVPRRLSSENGIVTLTISERSQMQSGFSTLVQGKSDHRGTITAAGNVMSVDGLIELRTRYLNAVANANLATASLNNTQKDFLRKQALNDDGKNVSDHALLLAKAAFNVDRAKVQAAETEAKNLRYAMIQSWGDVLAAEAGKESPSIPLKSILDRQESLISITAPLDNFQPKVGSSINISLIGNKSQLIRAVYVGPSPELTGATQGKTYFYRAPAAGLRSGMRVSAELGGASVSSAHTNNIAIPTNAVVWYGGEAWVYKKLGKDQFFRVALEAEDSDEAAFYSTSHQLKEGDAVVIVGAQSLLSEEFKTQIRNDNDD